MPLPVASLDSKPPVASQRRSLLRQTALQIHLWLGLALAAYVAVIGFTGALLVFKEPLSHVGRPRVVVSEPLATHNPISVGDALKNAGRREPALKASLVVFPHPGAAYYSVLMGDRRSPLVVAVDPANGHILQVETPTPKWLAFVAYLHSFLLFTPALGIALNGIGAATLLLVTVSGLVLWWPRSTSSWKRALWVNPSLSFKRITRDSHSIVGFFAVALLSLWSVTGMYFAWPKATVRALNIVSHATEPRERLLAHTRPGAMLAVDDLLTSAQGLFPGELPDALFFQGTTVIALFTERPGIAFSQCDGVTLDGTDGKALRVLRQQDLHSIGDKLVTLLEPLHFGTEWGLSVRIVYFCFGMALPFLSITAVLMYWHRYLGRRWRSCMQS